MKTRIRERGEGKVGCIISLIVLAIAGGSGVKIIPVYYSNNSLEDAALRKAETAVGRDMESLTRELRDEARKLEITEAMAPGAITFTKKAAGDGSLIVVKLRYTRKVDLYGVTQFDIPTEKTIERPVYENIR